MSTILTDDDRQKVFESLPDALEGFMKKWGWLQADSNGASMAEWESPEDVADEEMSYWDDDE